MKKTTEKNLVKLITDLGWDYDRLSSSGQETLDKIFKLLNIYDDVTKEEIIKMGCPKKLVHLYTK
jgi:hypothetical protein